MSDGFFQHHPGLGSMFDYNRNGKVDLPEAVGMGGVASAYASEMLRATKEAEEGLKEARKKRKSPRRSELYAGMLDDEPDGFDDDGGWDDEPDDWDDEDEDSEDDDWGDSDDAEDDPYEDW